MQNRWVNSAATGTTGTEQLYTFSHDGNDSGLAGRTQTRLDDPAGNRKKWLFFQGQTQYPWLNGLPYQQEVYQGPAYTLMRVFATEWTQDDISLGYQKNPRPRVQRTMLDDGALMRTEQEADANGNVTEVRWYPLTPGGQAESNTIIRTITATYQTASAYTSRYILNRPLLTKLYAGPAVGGTLLMDGSTSYDGGILTNVAGALMHDTTNYGTSFTTRGNPTTVRPVGGLQSTATYSILGTAIGATDSGNHSRSANYSATTGWVAPDSVNLGTPVSGNATWYGDMRPNNISSASGESISYAWDSAQRPTTVTSPSGSTTTYQYNDLAQPPTVVQTTQVLTGNGNAMTVTTYTITRTMDGFGRVVKVLDSRSNAIVETEYDACSCSSTGKQKRVTNPYIAGQTKYWTTTTSDALGRTKTVVAPDNSTTTYNYAGNLTEIIDPAGKKKLYQYDALGNLITVAEPDSGGINYTVFTSYGYDAANRLRTVSMNGGLQTRTFNYNSSNQLTSEVHPESGTTTYTYNADGQVLTKTDARGNQVTFEYDEYHRMTRAYQSAGTGGHEKRFYYDTYPADPGAYIYGRLAAIEWTPPPVYASWEGSPGTQSNSYKHVFGYTTYGAMTRSKLTATSVYTPDVGDVQQATTVMEAQFTWTWQGEMATITYPTGRSLYNKFDSAGRLNGLHQNGGGGYPDQDLVTATVYTTAGQLATMDFYRDPLGTVQRRESRTYNNLLQLTNIWVGNQALGARHRSGYQARRASQ